MARTTEKAEKYARSEVLNDVTEEISENEETQELRTPEWTFDRGMTILKIEDGILSVLPWNSEALEKESKKNNWFYRIKTADDRFAVIDYDKDKARPYVKALLAKVNRLREVKLLYFVLGIVILHTFGLITLVVQNALQSSKIEDIAKAKPAPITATEKPLPKPLYEPGALDGSEAEPEKTSVVFPR